MTSLLFCETYVSLLTTNLFGAYFGASGWSLDIICLASSIVLQLLTLEPIEQWGVRLLRAETTRTWPLVLLAVVSKKSVLSPVMFMLFLLWSLDRAFFVLSGGWWALELP